MLLEGNQQTFVTDEAHSPTGGAATQGVLLMKPIETREPDRGDMESTLTSDFTRTYRALCALAPAVERHGLRLENPQQLVEGSRFRVDLKPQREMYRPACSLEDAVLAFFDDMRKASLSFRDGADHRRSVAPEDVRLIGYLTETRQRIALPFAPGSEIQPPPRFLPLTEKRAKRMHQAFGTIVWIDSKSNRVLLTGNQLVEGIRTDGLVVGSSIRLQCIYEDHETLDIYRLIEADRSTQLGLLPE